MQFKGLALLFASAALAQSETSITEVSFDVGNLGGSGKVPHNSCTKFSYGDLAITKITVTPVTSKNPTCTFYTEDDCKGQEYSLKEGEHEFSRDFFVASWICKETE